LSRLDAAIILTGCTIGLITAAPILLGNNVLPAGSVSAGDGAIGSHGLKAFDFMNQRLINLYGLGPARFMMKALFLLKLSSLLVGFRTTFRLQIAKDVKLLIDNLLGPVAQGFTYYMLTTMTCAWIGCYATTISYDYRSIFLPPLIAILAQLAASQLEANPANSPWAAMIVAMAILPGILTTPFMALGTESLHAYVGHEIMVEFIMLPIVAGSATALMIQFLGVTAFLNHLLPAPAPTQPDPHR
jgi:hypothetical protein